MKLNDLIQAMACSLDDVHIENEEEAKFIELLEKMMEKMVDQRVKEKLNYQSVSDDYYAPSKDVVHYGDHRVY